MTIYDEIKKKIKKEIDAEKIILIDNSRFHSKHKSFDPKKFHLKIIVHSKKLSSMNKVEAHKKIFSILKNEMKNKIHALEIEIK